MFPSGKLSHGHQSRPNLVGALVVLGVSGLAPFIAQAFGCCQLLAPVGAALVDVGAGLDPSVKLSRPPDHWRF
jgi:hypothetical protein